MDEIMEHYYTYFIDQTGSRIGSLPGIIPVSKGMGLHVHGHEGKVFIVESSYLKIDHPDRDPGLYVIVREETK